MLRHLNTIQKCNGLTDRQNYGIILYDAMHSDRICGKNDINISSESLQLMNSNAWQCVYILAVQQSTVS